MAVEFEMFEYRAAEEEVVSFIGIEDIERTVTVRVYTLKKYGVEV